MPEPQTITKAELIGFTMVATPAFGDTMIEFNPERETRDVRAQGPTPGELLVSWVNECVYVHEIEGFAVRRVTVAGVADGVAHGVLHGEPLEPGRHRLGTVVKGVTHHRVSVAADAEHCEVRIIVDV